MNWNLKLENTYKVISHKETYSLRHKILRKNQLLEACKMTGDTLGTTIHLGVYQKESLIGIISCMDESFHYLTSSRRLRGMAILPQNRHSGTGSYLLEKIEEKLRVNKIKWVWLNAREKALNFYLKNSYVVVGSPFNLPLIGKHYSCIKAL